MDLRVLGPFEVRIDGAALPLGAPKQQGVLALLAIQANHAVGMDELVDELWPDREPPVSAVANVRSYAANLRRLFKRAEGRADRISRRGSGYLLHVELDELDLLAFRAECRRGMDAAEHNNRPVAIDLLATALDRRRGPVLSGLCRGPVLTVRCSAVEAELTNAVEKLAELRIGQGQVDKVIPALQLHIREHPLRERAHGLLIQALHKSGDVAGALSAYSRARSLLIDELGIEPGPELQHLHRSVLNREQPAIPRDNPDEPKSGTDASPAPRELPTDASPAPRELPADVGHFVGRRREFGRVSAALAGSGTGGTHRPAVVVLYGSGGIGKSALAIHVAHAIADSYPDGQVYVDLHGSSPGLRSLAPVEALRRLLGSLGVPQGDLPPDEDAAAGQFRSVTFGKRLLFVLDNAADARQVIRLLPASGGCGVIITARQPLATLDADIHLHLGALSATEGRKLLEQMTAGLAIERSTAEAIVALCDHLPLAIRIAAGRLLSRPDLAPTELAERLADRDRRLDELELEGIAVRPCIRVGYDALVAGRTEIDRLAARVFRALGVLNVPDFQPAVVSAMLPEPEPDVERALNQLVAAQLATVTGGRYRLHDLVRLVAAETAAEKDDQQTRNDMVRRGLAYYAGGILGADEAMRPGRSWIPTALIASANVDVVEFAQPAYAKAWVDAELANVVAVADQARRLGRGGYELAMCIAGASQYALRARNEWQALHRLARQSLDAAKDLRDQELIGWAEVIVGRGEAEMCIDTATCHFEAGLAILKPLGNVMGIAMALNALGIVAFHYRKDLQAGLSYFTECLAHARRHALRAQEANVRYNLGNLFVLLAQWTDAREHLEQALAIHRERADREGMGSVCAVLAAVHCANGDLSGARASVDDALLHTREVGSRRHGCQALLVGSEAHLRSDDHAVAARYADEALSMAESCRYAYGKAAALRQQAKIAAATGRLALAATLSAEAAAAFANLSVPPDPVFESVLAQEAVVSTT